MYIDTMALPAELLALPQPLIGFFGLDTQHSTHKAIWDAFSNRKSERPSMQFKLLSPNYEFPYPKPRRSSYEWYQPKGILKRNWMLKHLHVLPAVVVLFFEIEWNDLEWNEKQILCASTVQSLKNKLRERNVSICIVLLQKSAPLPPGEDFLASERAASLTTACNFNSKMLFILPYTEHLLGYTLRLESAFLDMAQNYYKLLSKRIRNHRDQLTASHTTLIVRHQFKLGFLSEIKQDPSSALKHYTQSYATLENIRFTDVNSLEIKTIAGFLNYKICRLMFKLKIPRDSINHFNSHIEKYKNHVELKDLMFEHFGWISTQYNVFAELFCDAIKNGLPALQIQHPGFYFHKAAEYTDKRRDAFLQTIVSTSNSMISTNSEVNNVMSLYTEFFGIRSYQKGESASENQLNILIRENEKSFNYSGAIIHYLGQAMAQFKIYKCLRFRKKLAIDMAEEYFTSGDYAKALTLYSLMLPDYRQDKWISLFSNVLLKALNAALLSAAIPDFIACSIEALSLKICKRQDDRLTMLENLWKIFQLNPPINQYETSTDIWDLWQNALMLVKSPVQISLDVLTELFEVYTYFKNMELNEGETVKLHLILKVVTDVPIEVRNVSILLTNGKSIFSLPAIQYKQWADFQNFSDDSNQNALSWKTFESVEKNFKLEPDTFYELICTTDSKKFLDSTQLRISSVEIAIGTNKLYALLLKTVTFSQNLFQKNNSIRKCHGNIKNNLVCNIPSTFHLKTQIHPIKNFLVNDYNILLISVNNPYTTFLQNVGLQIKIPFHLYKKVFLATDLSLSKQKLYQTIEYDVGELSMNSSTTISFYIFSLAETIIEIQQKMWYTLDIGTTKSSVTSITTKNEFQASVDVPSSTVSTGPPPKDERIVITSPVQVEYLDENHIRKSRDDVVNMKCELNFQFAGRFYTFSKKPLQNLFSGEDFLFRCSIETPPDSAIDILETYIVCAPNFIQSTFSYKGKKLKKYGKRDILYDVIVLRGNSNNCSIFNEQNTNINPQRSTSNCDHELNIWETYNKNGLNLLSLLTQSNKIKQPINLKSTQNPEVSSNSEFFTSRATNAKLSLLADNETRSDFNINAKDDNFEIFQEVSQPVSHTAYSVFHKSIDFYQAHGHTGVFKQGVLCTEHSHSNQRDTIAIYAIRWKRIGSQNENESKFIVSGIKLEQPLLNIYCTIDEKLFVKMPMTFKVTMENPTENVIHLSAILIINNADNFICSGHRQIDISIVAFGQKDIVYNLYPLRVGWQKMPALALEYKIHAGSNNNIEQNNFLKQLIQRSMPKRVFVLPPLNLK